MKIKYIIPAILSLLISANIHGQMPGPESFDLENPINIEVSNTNTQNQNIAKGTIKRVSAWPSLETMTVEFEEIQQIWTIEGASYNIISALYGDATALKAALDSGAAGYIEQLRLDGEFD